MGFFKIAGAGEECYHAVFSGKSLNAAFAALSKKVAL